MGRFEDFQELEEKYLPKEMVEEGYSSTKGFGACGFSAKEVL